MSLRINAKLVVYLIILRLFLEPFNAYGTQSRQMFLFYLIPVAFVCIFIILAIKDRHFANYAVGSLIFKILCIMILYQICVTIAVVPSFKQVIFLIPAVVKVVSPIFVFWLVAHGIRSGQIKQHQAVRLLIYSLNILLVINLFIIFFLPGLVKVKVGYSMGAVHKILGIFVVKDTYGFLLLTAFAANIYMLLKKERIWLLCGFLTVVLVSVFKLNSRAQFIGMIIFLLCFVFIGISRSTIKKLVPALAVASIVVIFGWNYFSENKLLTSMPVLFKMFIQRNPIDIIMNSTYKDPFWVISSGRTMIWQYAFKTFESAPLVFKILGGPLYILNGKLTPDYIKTTWQIGNVPDPHSDFFFILLQFGILGILLCAVKIITVFIENGSRILQKVHRRTDFLDDKMFLALFIAFLLSSIITNGILGRYVVLIHFAALMASLITKFDPHMNADNIKPFKKSYA
jgi:hypothetical protein